MKTKNSHCGLSIAVVLQLGVLASSAQTGQYLYTGSETTITLNPGTYDITAYGAQGGNNNNPFTPPTNGVGGLGAEMEAKFNFTTATTLTLLVGGGGGNGGGSLANYGGGGGGGSFVVSGSIPLVVAGGGGGGGDGGLGNDTGGNGVTSSYGDISPGAGYGYGSGGSGGSGGGGGFEGGGGGGGFEGGGGGGTNVDSYGGSSFLSGGAGGYGDGGGGGFGGGGSGGGGGGGGGGYSGGGGGGLFGGGGGGSIIDSSAVAVLTEVSGIASPNGSTNGEIIITTITAAPAPALAISTYSNQPAVFFPTATGTNFVLQMTTNLTNGNWVTVTNGIPISGLIITNPPAAAFFRLH